MEELSKKHTDASLFNAGEGDSLPAKRSREQFEKFFVPGFTVLLFLSQAAAAYLPWKTLTKLPPLITERATLGMALLGLFGLVLFLLGKYSSGLARLEGQRLLRPGASYLMLSAYACFLVIASMGAVLAGFPKVDLWVGRVLCVVVGLIAVETLLGLVLEIYRVRVRGREVRLLYESRLVGLLSKPEAIITTVAHALDYQFGFKVSETAFYRFLAEKFPLLFLGQLVILLLSTCPVFIEPGQHALLERFGAPVKGREVIGPGLHLTMPWPIDKVYRYATDQIQSFTIGAEEEETNTVVLWSVAHTKEDNMLVASHGVVSTNADKISPPVNLLAVGVPVQFQVTNLVDWAYVNEDSGELLRKIASREVVNYLASADLDDLMTRGRARAAEDLRQRIQKSANERRLGAQIVFVGVDDLHPPVKVAENYEKVIGAAETREAKVLDAQASAWKTNALARAESFKRERVAEAECERRVKDADARAVLFTNQLQALNAAPDVYKQRAYFQMIAQATDKSRKYVIGTTNTSDVIIWNLEDKIRPDLENMSLPAPKK
jgi:regulator of protease activity HflC (stomatin/prohibitin superfamily)